VVLEDLHDADRGTLDLLLFLARNLQGARLLVLGTYRDVEVDRAHPLSAVLAELHRASNFARIHLRGLSRGEVLHLLTVASRQRVPQPFAELVHRRTDGNPLFVHEILRYVIEEGLVERRDGVLRGVGQGVLAGQIPEGLRDAVGRRLSRLSASTNRVLGVAAIIGREFQLDILECVLSSAEEEVERALEEATAAAIIEELSVVGSVVTYRFSHAFFQQTLHDEILAPRRIRLHQQVAHALEEIDRTRVEEHAAELAEHYGFSSDPLDLGKAVHYGELAARHASEAFAYGEAARQLDRALVMQELADPDDRLKRCDLLLALGDALSAAGEPGRVMAQLAPEARALAEALGDRRRAFRACHTALESLVAQGAATSTRLPEYLEWALLARSYADPDSVERALADLALAGAWISRHRMREARSLRLDALALSRRLGDPETLVDAAFFVIFQGAPQHWDERLQLTEEFVGWTRAGVSSQSLGRMLWYAARLLLAHGERARAEDLWRQVQELAARTHLPMVKLLSSRGDVVFAIVDGELEMALASMERFIVSGDGSGAAVGSRQFSLSMLLAPALYLGRAQEWLAAFEQFSELAGQASQAIEFSHARAVCLAHLGQLEESQALVGPHLEHIVNGTDDPETPMFTLAWLLEAAVLLGDRRAARALSERLACVAHLSIGEGFYTCPPRHLGDAAVLLGDRAAARTYYLQALEAAGKIRFRPELALIHLRLAELLLEEKQQNTRSEALQHLELAIPELQAMTMQAPFERALSIREKHAPSSRSPSIPLSASNSLTPREWETASLVAIGLSNRDIAERLVISEGTVEVHLKHIMAKLECRSRTQVARWFAEQPADGPRPSPR
jgi:DNA-binding CsgD family transcriptional regulator